MRIAIPLLILCACSPRAVAESLTGNVIAKDGQPAAGATVTAAAIFHSPPLRKTTSTDGNGAFQLDLPTLSGSKRYALAVRWQTYGADLTDGLDTDGKKTSLRGQKLPSQAIRLGDGGTLRGRVLSDEDGAPIPGARLFLDTGEVLTTDERGEFALGGLRMTEHSLIPVAPARVRQYVLFDTTLRPDCELELRLERGAVVKGRILDERGDPVPQGYVTRSSSGTALTLNGWDEVAQADGTFEYGGLSSRRLFYSVQVCAPGFASQSVSSEVDDALQVIPKIVRLTKRTAPEADEEEESAEPVEAKAAGATLPRRDVTGLLRTTEGAPIAGAVVRWGAFRWDPSIRPTKTDEAGRYALAQVPQSDGAILFIAPDYAPQFVPVRADDAAVNAKLDRGTTVRGVVRGPSGQGISGVCVIPQTRCLETGFCNPIWLDERRTETDESGKFEIHALPELGVSFDFLKDGYSEQRGISLHAGGEENDVRLQAGGGIRGLVLDPAGKPVRTFNIRVMIPRGLNRGEPAGGYYAGYDWYGISYTRDDGVFVLSGIGANTWMRFIVSSPGVGRAVINRVKAQSGDRLGPAEDLTIKLLAYIPLRVIVTDARSGRPVPQAHVALLEDVVIGQGFNWGYHDLWAERRRADQNGSARFTEPACEDGTILVSAPGFARTRLEWQNGAREIQASLAAAATVKGDVRLRETLLAEGYVRLSSPQDTFTAHLDTSGGRFEFDQLPAGTYSLAVLDRNSRQIYTANVSLEPGDARTEDITLGGDPERSETAPK
jgi:hypothetical protein